MHNKTSLGAMLAIVLCITTFDSAVAQILEGAGAVVGAISPIIAKKSVANILQDARQQATSVLADGRNAGNSLMVRGADELNMAALNISNIFSDRMDSTFEKLDESSQKIIAGLVSAQDAANKLSERAYTAKDTVALDTQVVLGSIPFTNERYIIQRISGLTQLQKTGGDYRVRLIGSYVGTPSNGPQTKISVKLDQKDIPGVKFSPVELHVLDIIIPGKELNPHFSSDNVAVLDLDISVEYNTKKRTFLIFSGTDKQVLDAHLHMALFPTYAGKSKASITYAVQGWKSAPEDYKEETGPNAHCESNCQDFPSTPWSFTYVINGGERTPQLIGDMRIVSAKWSQINGSNPFDWNQSVAVTDSKTRATFSCMAHTKPQSYRLTVAREVWSLLRDETKENIVDIFYDKVTEIKAPLGKKTVRLRGVTLTGDAYDQFIGGMPAIEPIEIVNVSDNAEDTSIFIRARRPSDLN